MATKTATKKVKIIAVAGAKGGVGKTTISTNIIPSIILSKIPNARIDYIEIDNNNRTADILKDTETFSSTESITVDEGMKRLQKMVFKLITEKNDSHHHIVLDLGGGDDTHKVMKMIKDLELTDLAELIYVVPVTASRVIGQSIMDMNQKGYFKDEKVIYMLNNIRDEKNIKDEFKIFFGDSQRNIPSIYDELKQPTILAIPHCGLFDVVSLSELDMWEYSYFARKYTLAQYTKVLQTDERIENEDWFVQQVQKYTDSMVLKEYIETNLKQVEL